MMRWLVIAVFLAANLATASNAEEQSDKDTGLTRILVTFADPGLSNATRAGPAGPGYRRRSSVYLASVGVKRAASRIARDFDLVTLDEWPIVSLKVHCLVFGVEGDVKIGELLARLNERTEVESAQLMNEFEVSASLAAKSTDPFVNLQHNHATLELTQAHNWSLGDGTDVTIIDTGADLDHPELRTQVVAHRDFVDNGGGEFSADAHGTAVAGVIGAASDNGEGMVGVAPSARLSVLKACWYGSDRTRATCDSFTLAKALSHAIESKTDVINLSLGGPADALLGRLVMQALGDGIIVVAAAPNHNSFDFPAKIAGVIVVDKNGRDDAVQIPIKAPGDDILVPVPAGGYDYASGTSLSAAQVSGIAALLVAQQPDLTGKQISDLLVASRPTINQSVNACRSLAELLQRSGCRGGEAVSQTR